MRERARMAIFCGVLMSLRVTDGLRRKEGSGLSSQAKHSSHALLRVVRGTGIVVRNEGTVGSVSLQMTEILSRVLSVAKLLNFSKQRLGFGQ